MINHYQQFMIKYTCNTTKYVSLLSRYISFVWQDQGFYQKGSDDRRMRRKENTKHVMEQECYD